MLIVFIEEEDSDAESDAADAEEDDNTEAQLTAEWKLARSYRRDRAMRLEYTRELSTPNSRNFYGDRNNEFYRSSK